MRLQGNLRRDEKIHVLLTLPSPGLVASSLVKGPSNPGEGEVIRHRPEDYGKEDVE